jgi:putative component of toxin-antitoxin plasmid stabilization module
LAKNFRHPSDAIARHRISVRIKRASMGNLGDWTPVGGGAAETRIDHWPGDRA